MPKSVQRWVTSLSVSSKLPSSSMNSMRSRADIFPALCCFSRRSAPPPSSARESRFLSSASFCSRSMARDYRTRKASTTKDTKEDEEEKPETQRSQTGTKDTKKERARGRARYNFVGYSY